MKTTLQTTTITTSWKDHTVFENSNIRIALKGLKCHNEAKLKKRVIPIVTVSENSLEIAAITGLSLILQNNQQN